MTGNALHVLTLFMNDRDDVAVRRLRELAELGMERARALQKQMLAAKNSEVAGLALEFERAARAVRQAIAGEAELERRRRRAQRLARNPVPSPRPPIPEPRNRTVH